MRRPIAAVAVGIALAVIGTSRASDDTASLSAQDIYDGACASCHGVDGRGAPEGTAITVPLPDFTDCSTATREDDASWLHLIEYGGAGLGLSPQMPAFANVLTPDQRQTVLDYVRSLCRDPRWPRGELNFRRPIFTTKAFPEDEALLFEDFARGRDGVHDWSTEASVEHRVGPRGQIELAVPLAVHDMRGGSTTGGVGDITTAYKHVLYASLRNRSILSAGLDLVLPTGDRKRSLGNGTVSFEPALLAGKELGNFVMQGEIRGVAPVDEGRADREVRYDLAFSYALSRLRRAWVPAVEVETRQNVTTDQHHVLVTPQIYKGLSKRGHIAVGIGAQVPVAGDARPFDYRIVGFLLWDYADGGLWW
ncbi:MAG: c-type cytochrome [Candidatus Binatia bacterium]